MLILNNKKYICILKDNSSVEKILIVGQNHGFGGVQSVHRNLTKAYIKKSINVQLIYNFDTFIKFLFKNQKIKIVYFSGLSILLSPFFIKCNKHVFFIHGFYIYESPYNNFFRFLKKFIYEFSISIALFFYRWVYCIAPSPVSGLINSQNFSRKVSILHWGVDDDYINYSITDKSYKYHLTFLGRSNSQKIKKSSLDVIIKLFIESEIIQNASDLKISFIIPKINKYSKNIIEQLKIDYSCKIDIYENKSNDMIRQILSDTLYFFSCYEWEAFGITYIEALCMGCNILIPSTSPIIPMIDNISESPVYKYTPPQILNYKYFANKINLSKNRPSLGKVQYYRSIFNWDTIIEQVNEIINV